MSPDDIRKEIELKVVELLKAHLSDGTMTEERSKAISKIVLDLLQPGMNLTNLYKAIMQLDDSCPELSPIVLPYAKQYEDSITKQATSAVQNYIRVGQYDAAIDLAKKVASQ
ncbi:TPA: hypothetical protein DIS60_01400, partial [Patescibacteria group bacterium]|nr:hypothetical protein [Patescibacteria group bacterium]